MSNDEFVKTFKDEIKQQIILKTTTSDEEKYIDEILSKYLIVTPRAITNNITFVNMRPHCTEEIKGVSIKVKNIQLNLREAMFFTMESFADFEVPGDAIGWVKLCFKVLLKAYIVATVEINNSDCLLLVYLHKNNAYNIPKPEESIFEDIENGELELTRDEYVKSIRKLMKLASVLVIHGDVYLQEKIVLKY